MIYPNNFYLIKINLNNARAYTNYTHACTEIHNIMPHHFKKSKYFLAVHLFSNVHIVSRQTINEKNTKWKKNALPVHR